MKKLAPVLALILLLTMVFVSCGKDEEETTTVVTTQPVASTTEAVSETETDANGYVLTTKPGDTMPNIQTTAYVSETDVDMSALTGGTVTAPVVVTDYVSTTEVPTLPTSTEASDDESDEGDDSADDNDKADEASDLTEASTTSQINEEISNNESTTTAKGATATAETTASTTEGNSATNKKLEVVGSANDEKGNVTILFDYDGWDRIKSQKARVTVTVNGKSRLMQGTVNGVDDNGQFSFTIDLSEKFDLSSGDYITMKFAKGAIESIGGGQQSAATQTALYYQ